MSRGKIIAMVVAAVMVVSGVSMLIIGLTVGASPIISIGNRNAADGTGIKTVSDTVELDDYDKAEIDVSSIDVIIEYGTGYSLEYVVREGREPAAMVKGGKLSMKQPSQSSFFVFDFRNITDYEHEYYKLTIPKECKRLDLDLEASSADITVNGVSIEGSIDVSSGDVSINRTKGEDLKLTSSSGHIDLANAEYEKLNVEVSSGDISFKDCGIDELECSSSSGEMTFDDLDADNIDVKASSGDIVLNIIGKEDDYSYDIDTSSGNIKIGSRKLDGDYQTEDDKSKSIKAETSSGNVTISFK